MKSLIKLSFILLILFTSLISINAQTAEKSIPIFENGEAQIVPGFEDSENWIRHDLWVEAEFDTDGDGKKDRMHVAVTRPRQTETEGLKLPIVYVSSPYFAGVAPNIDGLFWDVNHELGAAAKERTQVEVVRTGERPIISNSHIKTWVPRGYIVVHSSSPGTGLSQGAPTVGGDNESLAPKAVIDWLCGRIPGYTSIDGNEKVKAFWSTGKVGMTGTSYNGTIPLAAATTGVSGLEAIIPIAPNTSYYHYYRSNGLVRSPGGYLGEDIDVLYDFIHSGDESKRAYNNATVRDVEMKNGMDRITGDYNDFWAGRDYLNDMEPMKAALLMSHGFNDWNVMPEHSYRIYKAAQDKGLPCQIYYHQNGHGGPPPMTLMNKWFTRYLHGVENGVEKDPRAWIVREDDKRENPTPYANYPNPDAAQVKLHLNSGAPNIGGLSTTKPEYQGTETLVDNYSFTGTALASAEHTNHRLLYVSPTLTKDIHISGTANVTVTLSCNKPAANLSVWLVSLPWNEGRRTKITDNIITRGWADPQNHNSIRESEPLKRGESYEVSFDLMPDDQIIKKGQQIGLMIFSSDKEYTLHPEPGTELTIDLDKTTLNLPVVGGLKAFTNAIKEHKIDVRKSSGGSSGMEQLNDSTYLVVYDLKRQNGGVRLGMVKVTGETIDVFPIEVDSWGEGGISNDLESICAIPGKTNEYLIAESGNWQGNLGRMFHIRIDINTLKAKVLSSMKLPLLKRNDFAMTGDQYEAIHCLAYSENERIVILGERGGSEWKPMGVMRWGLWNIEKNTLVIEGEGLEGVNVNAPGNWENSLQKRSVTDMHIDQGGIIWASASEDQGDAGPFYSVIYKLGRINQKNAEKPVSIFDNLSIGREIYGFKIEALSGSKNDIDCTHTFGTEDEIYGGVWRPINIVTGN